MIEKCIELTSNLIQMIILTWFISKFFGYKYDGVKRVIGFTAICLIAFAEISFINSIIVYDGLVSMIVVVTYIVYAQVFLKGSIPFHIFIMLFSEAIIFTASSIILFVGAALSGNTVENLIAVSSSWRTVMMAIARISEFVVYSFVIKINDEYRLTRKEWCLFVSMPLFTWVAVTITTNATILSEEILPYMFYIVVVMLVINVLIYFFMFKIKQDSNTRLEYELLKMQHDNVLKMETNMKALFESTYSLKHDLDKHFFAIKELAAKENCSEISSYISKVFENNISAVQKVVFTDNDIFNAIINAKLELCKQKNIVVSISIDNQAVVCLKNEYIAVLFGNTLDNAIEAAEKADPKFINFVVGLKRGYVSVYIENSYNKEYSDTTLKTTKANNLKHGFGIKNVHKIVEENNGMIQYFEKENSAFCCDILLERNIV